VIVDVLEQQRTAYLERDRTESARGRPETGPLLAYHDVARGHDVDVFDVVDPRRVRPRYRTAGRRLGAHRPDRHDRRDPLVASLGVPAVLPPRVPPPRPGGRRPVPALHRRVLRNLRTLIPSDAVATTGADQASRAPGLKRSRICPIRPAPDRPCRRHRLSGPPGPSNAGRAADHTRGSDRRLPPVRSHPGPHANDARTDPRR